LPIANLPVESRKQIKRDVCGLEILRVGLGDVMHE